MVADVVLGRSAVIARLVQSFLYKFDADSDCISIIWLVIQRTKQEIVIKELKCLHNNPYFLGFKRCVTDRFYRWFTNSNCNLFFWLRTVSIQHMQFWKNLTIIYQKVLFHHDNGQLICQIFIYHWVSLILMKKHYRTLLLFFKFRPLLESFINFFSSTRFKKYNKTD